MANPEPIPVHQTIATRTNAKGMQTVLLELRVEDIA